MELTDKVIHSRRTDRPPPLPFPSLPRLPALAAIVGPREGLPPIYRDLIERLARQTIPSNTRRALDSDLHNLAAWNRIAMGKELTIPESEDAVARFTFGHSADLEAMAPNNPPRLTADVLIDTGLMRSRAMRRPSTLGGCWRLGGGSTARAAWRGRSAPLPCARLLARARAARRVVHGPVAKKSANPVDHDILDWMVAARAVGLHGLRDAALIERAWASGGRGGGSARNSPAFASRTSTDRPSRRTEPSPSNCARPRPTRRRRRCC